MALLIQSPEISSLAGRDVPASRAKILTRRSVTFRVSSVLKHLDQEVLKLRGGCDDVNNYELNVRLLNGQVKQQNEMTPSPSSRKRDEDEEVKKREYYVNTGYAIRTIREEFPVLFYRELSFDIYRDDIVFKDPLNTFAGIENYKSILWALSFHGKIFFKALWVDIISVWQPAENMIMIRWTVHGIVRVPWESSGRFDGTSEYKLDKDGKIYEHKVHNIATNGPQKFKVLAVEHFIQSIGSPTTPKPTYFEMSSTSTSSPMPLELSAIRRYLTSVLTSLGSVAGSWKCILTFDVCFLNFLSKSNLEIRT